MSKVGLTTGLAAAARVELFERELAAMARDPK